VSNDRLKTTPVVYLFDRLILGYSLMMIALLVTLGRPLGNYSDEIVFYLIMAALVALIVRYCDETAGGWRTGVRLLYPALVASFFYRITGGQMFLVFDQFFDAQLVAWEYSVLGINPTLYIDRNLLNVPMTEVLSFCYFCYYPLLPGFVVMTFFRRDYQILRQYLTAAIMTFFASYVVFWLYPIEGPRWFFAEQYLHQVEGPVFRQLVDFVMDHAAVRGGAMPSSHTGVALVTLIFCFRYYRRLGWALLPIVTGLALGTVWGRFHYASDVVVGALLGVAAVALVWKQGDRSASTGSNVRTEELRTHNVS
jgi:membrane-associated phospholipid phosphatase